MSFGNKSLRISMIFSAALSVFVCGKCRAQDDTLFTLSDSGCGRATAYSEFNKIVSVGDKTHVSWLDSHDGEFRVKIRTLDRDTGKWSPTYTVGQAYDNHGGPSLTADSRGYLHIVYYPHHHPFRYRRSVRPNDASEWSKVQQFGRKCTYSSLVCMPDDTLLLACRESSGGRWLLNLYTKKPTEPWSEPRTLLHGQAPKGYTRWQAALVPDRSGSTIHMSFMLYEQTLKKVGYAVGYLRSQDCGRSWLRSNNDPVKLPAVPATIEIVAGTPAPKEANYRPGNVAIGPDGLPWIIYSRLDSQPYGAFIACSTDSGWKKISLLNAIRDKWPGRAVKTPGSIAFDRSGTMYLAVTTVDASISAEDAMWGHPSAEVALLVSKDRGRTFSVYQVSKPDANVPNWLPNLERPARPEPIGVPSLIYTHGHRGENNRQIMSNDAVFCNVADLIETD